MTVPDRRPLPPMEAIEFAIDAVFRHFFFGLRLALGWAIVLLPLAGLAWFLGFRNGPPADWHALPPQTLAGLGLLGLGVLLASFSIAVSWHRRLLLDESPRGLRWLRLDGVMWRYLFGWLVLLVAMGLYGAAGFAVATKGPPALAASLGPAAKPVCIAAAVLLGLSALFTLYRLLSWLAGIAVGDRDYRFGVARRATKGNRIRYLFFTFWLLFTLAIAGAMGAGAFFGQKALANPWVTIAAFVFIGVLAWMALFLITSVAPSHYRFLAPKRESE
jgi:hypothetical protein